MKYLFLCFVLALNITATETPTIKAPANWSHEEIALPPQFAPNMNFKGIEHIYFAPGMFSPSAKYFFSYAFLLSGKYDGKLDETAVKAELLKYYQGLAKAAGKKYSIDVSKFSLKLSKEKSTKTENYSATLNWVEPFKTGKKQTLNFAVNTWSANGKTHLFAIVSPASKDSKIWAELKEIQKKSVND